MPSNAICARLRPVWRLRWPLLCRSAPRWRWVMWFCPLLLLPACGSQPASNPPTPIPPSLDRPCHPGPALPAGDVTVRDLLEILAQREAAARECRARVQGLRAGWPR